MPIDRSSLQEQQEKLAEHFDLLMLKATRVDGVFDSDPEINKDAKFFDSLSFDDAISKNLKVMDATALTLARDHGLPINVFNVNNHNALKDIICGKKIGTLIS